MMLARKPAFPLARALHSRNTRENAALKNDDKPIRNPHVVLREEFDDWAVLFNPETGRGFGLNPTGVYLWKLIDGQYAMGEMLRALSQDAADISKDASAHIAAFIAELACQGLVTREGERHHRSDRSTASPRYARIRPGDVCAMRLVYEMPKLINLSGEPVCGECANGSGNTSFKCDNGVNTTVACYNGTIASGYCETGTSPASGCQYCYQGCSVTSWRGCTPACSCGTQPGVCNTGNSAGMGCIPVGNSG